METIQVQLHGDVYSCDIGISKEEWLEILKDDKTPQTYKETVLQFYYYPAHRGSCTAVGNAMGGNAQKINANIREFGKYVQKRLGRFLVARPDGTPCFWIIPMCEGKDLPKGSEGTFEWELRPELVEAVKDYLYWYLVEKYKEVRKEFPIDGKEWTEIYKWELITASKGKTPFEIVRNHLANPRKSELGGFDNLIDAARDNKTLKHLVENNPEGLRTALEKLTNEDVTLRERLANYKTTMASLLPASGFNSKANDERMASIILTCVNPQKYTIYKYDVYTLFCKFLGEDVKATGRYYEHFLDLLKPLCELASQDEALQQLVSSSLQGKEKSNLLLAQDVLWMLFVEFPEKLGFIRSVILPNKQRVWLWSINYFYNDQEYLACGSSAKTIKDFRPYKSRNALRKAYQQDVGNSDLKIPDAYWSFLNEVSIGDIVVVFDPKKGNGKQYHLLHGWGIITSDCIIDETNENPMKREVQWYNFLEIPKQNEEMGNSLFFQGTTAEQALHIKELLNINTDMIMESKYQKYIDLLETNKNLILTGAPGTGKTFIAKAIAEEMGAEVGFVQFHPSYDYTDFVEGLRPKNDGKGNVGFERKDGVFKEFCKSALLNVQVSSQPSVYLPSTHGNDFDKIYRSIVDDIKSGKLISYQTPYKIQHLGVKDGRIVFRADSDSPRTESEKNLKLLFEYFVSNHIFDLSAFQKDYYWKLVAKLTEGKTKTVDYVEYGWILQEMLNRVTTNYSDTKEIDTNHPDVIPSDEEIVFANRKDEQAKEKFIFIIDEINRGELSKIFGELFFSIDPGYRGKDGRVKTQYANMVTEPNEFDVALDAKDYGNFFVPENVYIIGTMNDIDRSVESMDFAMRRRFAWQEVTAEESYANMIENDAEFAGIKDEIKARMFNLNNAIAKTEGLNEAYQIGAAYFRKYLDYQDKEKPFECLWNNHLKGLLFEYLRGNRKAKELLEKLHKAYNKTSIDEQPAHTNDGQL